MWRWLAVFVPWFSMDGHPAEDLASNQLVTSLPPDLERLAQRLLDEGWLTAPGLLFSASRQPGTLMRINFATAQDAGFWRLLARLRKDMLG